MPKYVKFAETRKLRLVVALMDKRLNKNLLK